MAQRPLKRLLVLVFGVIMRVHLLAVTHASRPAMLLREESLCVTQEELWRVSHTSVFSQFLHTYNIITLHTIDLAPSIHDPAIVACNGSDDVNALLAKLVDVLDIRGKVVSLAAGSESTLMVVSYGRS